MKQSTYNSLKSFIWGIANDCLVDVYDVGDYRKIILPMFVIRRFDAVLEPTHDAVVAAKKKFEATGKATDFDPALMSIAGQAFVNKSDFTLTDLKSRTNQQQLKKDFINYLDGFSANVQEIINKFHIRNEIDRLSEQDRLGLLIEKFVDPRYNFSNRDILNEDGSVRIEALDNHTMGTLFEEVIRMFNEETNVTDAGRHFTPRDIVELIADLAFIPVQGKIQSTTYRIYDGACGTGGMLTVGEEHINKLAEAQGKKVSIHLYPEFYLRVFQVAYKRRIFYKFGKGAANQGRWRLPQRAFYNYSIQIPPIEEQKAIEYECKQLEKNIDEMIEALKKEMDLLQELRTKIIADVVTGQIDVRDVVVPDYSCDEDTDSDDIEDDEEEIEESED